MRALITGANGFLGTWLTRKLVERGDAVRCLVRPGSNVEGLEGLQVEKVEGDVTLPSTLGAAMEGIEVVFHLAGIRRAPEREVFFKVNTEGTRHVCEAMVLAGARRLVFCGSLAAAGPSSPERPREEDDPFAPEEWYGQSKAEAERLAFSYGDRLEVTVARPARILGPGDLENLTFFKLVNRGLLLEISGGPRPLSMVDVEDVVAQLVLMAEKKEAVGEAFFASSGETTTFEATQDQIAQCLGVTPRRLRLSPAVLSGLGNMADMASKLTGRHLPLNRKLARQLLAPAWTCSISKAQRLLGFEPKVGLDQSIARSAAWYQQRGWL